jgi:hypothetical protein
VIPFLGITPGDGRPLDDWVRALGRAGCPGLLIREPSLDGAALDALVGLACDTIPFVAVHDRSPHARSIARRRGLVLHLPAGRTDDVPFAASTHDEDEVTAALAAGAAYCVLSPVWSPSSKPTDARPTLGLSRFLAAAADRPVLALGGVTPERYRRLRAAGAGAAVLGPLAVADPTAPMCRYLRA